MGTSLELGLLLWLGLPRSPPAMDAPLVSLAERREPRTRTSDLARLGQTVSV